MTLESLETRLLSLTATEKLSAIQILMKSIDSDSLGIVKKNEVCGGDACIANTRIPVWLLVSLRRQGSSDGELLKFYPRLNASDLVNAWAYASAYPDEIDRAIREEEAS